MNAEDDEGKLMTKNPRRLSKVAAALGGLLIMAGMILIGIFALTFFNILDPSTFLNAGNLTLFMIGLIVIGVLDVVSGIILTRG